MAMEVLVKLKQAINKMRIAIIPGAIAGDRNPLSGCGGRRRLRRAPRGLPRGCRLRRCKGNQRLDVDPNSERCDGMEQRDGEDEALGF